jgi:hypothetical protein
VAPSWMRTLTMSIGWMMHVAAMPLRPPLKKGLAAFQTGLSAAILLSSFCFFCAYVCVSLLS